ncbi:cytochrome ubiquinol oxidase subunit I [Actinokineospora sp. HUAS TT18]|uniref:cytochrome ubiquinol oxidase subunit I n=1 Tax=Actinokineospora sp. HUAS TT18 TaxID=3447451 RepID=UPI003F522E72
MSVLELARWQFGITTVYHFLMVPLTIGLALLVAGMQTAWVRTGNAKYLRMTRFWGKVLLINFAMGVVTGIVQEFQFGMAWSAYSRFVGDVFGAPLAMEGLVAFFVESTFLGLWIFGWDRLPKKVHLACAWAFSLATIASAYFILAANSWMQHPVGVEMVGGRPRLTSIWAVLGNSTALATIPHTIAGAFAVAGAVLVGVGAWWLRKGRDTDLWRTTTRWGGVVGLVSFAVLAVTGDLQAKLMFDQQPMKMAAAEALCRTEEPAGFSVFAVGDVSGADCASVKSVNVPGLLSFLAEGDFDAKVTGVDELVAQYQQRYGTNYPDDPALGELAGQPIDYVPNLPVTYWSFRLMIGFGVLAAAVAAWALWTTRRGRESVGRWPARIALWGIAAPVLANSFGWIFTEMGRQPFVVVPNPDGVDGVWMFTAEGVSGMTTTEVATSLIVLTLVYGALAVVEFFLLRRVVRKGVPPAVPPSTSDSGDDTLAFAY